MGTRITTVFLHTLSVILSTPSLKMLSTVHLSQVTEPGQVTLPPKIFLMFSIYTSTVLSDQYETSMIS